LIYLFFLASP